jgi:hypothetical protein
MNRQLCSDGTGALAYWTSADDSSGAIIDDGLGNVTSLYLQAGVTTCDLIDATDGTTNLSTANMVVTLGAATSTGYAVTWTGLVTGSGDADFLVRAGTMTSAGSLEMMGIGGIISAADPSNGAGGSLQGLAVASNSWWKAQDFGSDSSQVALAFEDIQEVIDAIATASDYTEQDIAFLFSNYGVRRAYYKLCIAERRHVNTMELDGGFKAVDFNGIPWVVDQQARRNTIYFVVPDTMKIFRTSDFDWMDKDGSYLSRVAGYDAYEAILFHYGNLACLSRNGNGILRGVLEA